jgi:hypothetical protein
MEKVSRLMIDHQPVIRQAVRSACRRPGMMRDHIVQSRRLGLHHVPAPEAETAARIDRTHPGIERHSLGAILLRVFAFDLDDQGFAVGQPDREVRHEAPLAAAPQIQDLESQMISSSARSAMDST